MRNPSQMEFGSVKAGDEDIPVDRAKTADMQSDALSAIESIKNNVSGIDSNLIKLLEIIEVQSRLKID